MLTHIVRVNDTVNKIANYYNTSPKEIIDSNKQITSYKTLIPGTKLKIPIITEQLEEELRDSEPFIEDYFPQQEYDYENDQYISYAENVNYYANPTEPSNETTQQPVENQPTVNYPPNYYTIQPYPYTPVIDYVQNQPNNFQTYQQPVYNYQQYPIDLPFPETPSYLPYPEFYGLGVPYQTQPGYNFQYNYNQSYY